MSVEFRNDLNVLRMKWFHKGYIALLVKFCLIISLQLINSYPCFAKPLFKHRFQSIPIIDNSSQLNGAITGIVEDKYHNIWFATDSGLKQFDGTRVIRYSAQSQLHPISNNNIKKMTMSPNGELWILTGLSIEKQTNDISFVKVISLKDYLDPVEFSHINDFIVGENDQIWLSLPSGIHFIDHQSDVHTFFPFPSTGSDNAWKPLKMLWINNTLWISGSGGIRYFNQATEKWLLEKKWPEELKDDYIYSFSYSKGNIYAASGKYFYQIDSQTFKVINSTALTQLFDNTTPITSSVSTSDGNIWLTTAVGLLQLNEKLILKNHYDLREDLGFSHTRVNILFVDSNENLWVVGELGGTKVLKNSARAFYHLNSKTLVGLDTGVSAISVNEDLIYIGTQDGKLVRINDKLQSVEEIPFITKNSFSLSPVINTIDFSQDDIWIGTAEGLYQQSISKKQTFYWHPAYYPNYPLKNIRGFYLDKKGMLWLVGATNKIVSINTDNKNFNIISESESWKKTWNALEFIAVSGIGNSVFFGSQQGKLLEYSKDKSQFVEHGYITTNSQPIFDIIKATKETIWLVSDESIIEYNPWTRKILKRLDVHSFNQSAIYTVLAAHNFLWLGGSSALFRYDKNSENYRQYDHKNGATSQEFNQASEKYGDSILFGTKEGVLKVETALIDSHRDNTQIFIKDNFLINHSKSKKERLLNLNNNGEYEVMIDQTHFSELLIAPRKPLASDNIKLGYSVNEGAIIPIENWQLNLFNHQFTAGYHQLRLYFKNVNESKWWPAQKIRLHNKGDLWSYFYFELVVVLLATSVAFYMGRMLFKSRQRFELRINKKTKALTADVSSKLTRNITFNELTLNSLDMIFQSKESRLWQSKFDYVALCYEFVLLGKNAFNNKLLVKKINVESFVRKRIGYYESLIDKEIKISFQSNSSVRSQLPVELVSLNLKVLMYTCIKLDDATINFDVAQTSARRAELKASLFLPTGLSVNDKMEVLGLLNLLKLLWKNCNIESDFVYKERYIEYRVVLVLNQKWRGVSFELAPNGNGLSNRLSSDNEKKLSSKKNVIIVRANKSHSNSLLLSSDFGASITYVEALDDVDIKTTRNSVVIQTLDCLDFNKVQDVINQVSEGNIKGAILMCSPIVFEHLYQVTEVTEQVIVLQFPISEDKVWPLIDFLYSKSVKANKSFSVNRKKLNKITEEGPDDKFKKLVLDVIQQNYSNPELNVDKLAELTHLSRSQFSRKLRKLTGTSPADYLKEFRLTHSTKLLDDGLSVQDAARMSGFSSQSYYTTCFKSRFGVSPSQWSQRH